MNEIHISIQRKNVFVLYLQTLRRSEEHLHLHYKHTVRVTAPLPAAHHQDPLIKQKRGVKKVIDPKLREVNI